jgi:calcium/proton exchanger cax
MTRINQVIMWRELAFMLDQLDSNCPKLGTTEIALFVAPVLVFASMAILPAQPLDLHFSPMELVMMLGAVAVLSLVSVDGETHWMEGVMLLAVYGILALAVYHLPDPIARAG